MTHGEKGVYLYTHVYTKEDEVKKYISMRIETGLLENLNRIKQLTKLSRTALIEEGIQLIVQLHTSPTNKQEIRKITNTLLSKRKELYRRLASK